MRFFLDTSLLKLFRDSKSRLSEEKLKAGYKKKCRVLFKWVGIYKYALSVPILWKGKKGILIHSIGEKGSKSYEAFKELEEVCDNSEESLVILTRAGLNDKVYKVFRIIPVVLFSFCLMLRLQKSRRISIFEKSLVLGLIQYRKFFSRNKQTYPVIISDVNPVLNLMAIASLNTGCVWWQDDFHHVYSGGLNVAKAFVLTNSEYSKFSEADLVSGLVYRKKNPIVKVNVSRCFDTSRISVAVNGFFTGSSSEIETLGLISNAFDVKKIWLRLHPTSKIDTRLLPRFVEVSSYSEPIEEYALNYDVIVVGNSAIQLKILALGTPVVHVGGLDPKIFDLYGYCRDGVVFGVQSITDFNIEDLAEFYKSDDYLMNFKDIMG